MPVHDGACRRSAFCQRVIGTGRSWRRSALRISISKQPAQPSTQTSSETAVTLLGPEKIIFGTDMPLLDPWTQLAKIRETAMDPSRSNLICGGNIARLIGLSPVGLD